MRAGPKREVERARELGAVAGEAYERFAVVAHDPRCAHGRGRTTARCDRRVVDRGAECAEGSQESGRAEDDGGEGQDGDQEWLLHLASFVRGMSANVGA